MDVPRERSIATRSGLLALALLAAAAGSLAEPNEALPAVGAPSLTIPFFVDRKLGDGMRGSLEEAARRLSDSRCQDVLGDFTDGRGRTLEANLRETGQSLPAYLGYVLFYDGSTTEACESERAPAAARCTSAGASSPTGSAPTPATRRRSSSTRRSTRSASARARPPPARSPQK